MVQNSTNKAGQLETKRYYRRLMVVCLVVGSIAYVVAVELGYVLIGTAVYWAGFVGMLVIWKGTDLELYDEREHQLELEAGGTTLTLFAIVLVFGAPGLAALDVSGYYEVPSVLWGVLLGYASVSVVFGVIYIIRRSRS